MHKALSTPKDRTLVKDVMTALMMLKGIYRDEAERVMNIGIPLATMAQNGLIVKISDEGREHILETLTALLCFKVAQDANETIAQAWARCDALNSVTTDILS